MTLHADLSALEASGLVRLSQIEPELEYLFRHVLIQDAAYHSLLKADRRRLHLMVGEALERLYPDRADTQELAPLLGQHFDEAAMMNGRLSISRWRVMLPRGCMPMPKPL